MKINRLPALLALIGFSTPGAFSQAAQQTSPQPLPSDPAALMQLAWQQNGLHGSDLKPWHVRASWQVVNDKGKPQKQGTWEEWWAGPHESKVMYDSPDFQQTTWSSAEGDFTQNIHGSWGWIEDLVEQMVLKPVASQEQLKDSRLREEPYRQHQVTLECATVTDKSAAISAYCFDATLPDLRTEVTPVLEITLNSVVRFQGRYLAEDVHVSRIGMPAIHIHLDQVESLSPTGESQLAPPPQAKLVQPRTTLTGGVIAGHRISGEAPEYPILAKQQYVQGTVSLWAVIGKDGVIHDLEVIGGPGELQKPSVEAVKTWHYKPYLLNGEPVEVETQINVVYRLGS